MTIDENNTKPFVAILVKGFDTYIWFEKEQIKSKSGSFDAIGGWGQGGSSTSLTARYEDIRGIIYSDRLQYR